MQSDGIEGHIFTCGWFLACRSFFRKMTNSEVEFEIYDILSKYPHPNIVDLYRQKKGSHIDIEYVNTKLYKSNIDYKDITKILIDVKSHLQKHGIIYVDWKYDQIGISSDGTLKLFDFDGSGIINTLTLEWITKPRPFFTYYKAVLAGIIHPIKLDDFSFDDNFINSIPIY